MGDHHSQNSYYRCNGFCRRHVLENLMAIDHTDLEIVAACRDPSALLPAYRGEIRVGDLRDSDYLDRLLVGIDIICHCAGWTSFLMDERLSSERYLEPTLELINRALQWHIPRFANLSSIAVAPPRYKNDALHKGQPLPYTPMLNCLIAVEDYMRAQSQRGCSFINLRAGIYSGHRLNMGLLQVLIANYHQHHQPVLNGNYGYFPLVDGQDIGQAFARAALVPAHLSYESFNVIGPDLPSQQQVMTLIAELADKNSPITTIPSPLARFFVYILEKVQWVTGRPSFSRCLLQFLCNPAISNTYASNRLGYHPKINWKSSIEWTWQAYAKQPSSPKLRQASRPDYLE